jgi:hypothetical protein
LKEYFYFNIFQSKKLLQFCAQWNEKYFFIFGWAPLVFHNVVMHTAYPYSIGYYEFEFNDRSIALGNANRTLGQERFHLGG